MKDNRPWGTANFESRLAFLRGKNPAKQQNLGMQRKCEHDLVLQVVKDAKPSAYVEIGSGNGLLLHKIRAENPAIRVVGFELQPLQDDFQKHRIELHAGSIFHHDAVVSDSFMATICSLIEGAAGPVVMYTDNGCKPAELAAVSLHMRLGDICGTHDFSGPDWQGHIHFLGERNFAIMEQYEPYILENLCLQRFWIKTDSYSGAPARCVL